MAKVLDALERARQEREKRMQDAPASENAAVSLAPEAAEPQPPIETSPKTNGTESAIKFRPSRGERPSALNGDISELVVAAHDYHSPIAEQLRHIRTNLETVLSDYRSRTIVITSPVSGDGKTLVAANLANVLADDPDHQTIIIDADMRKADQHHMFKVKQTPGLADYLKGNCSLEQAVHSTSIPNLKIIPAGHSPGNPTVLLGSERMLSLLGALQKEYRWVVFDTPPILPVTDASLLARECTGLILVVRMLQTHREVIGRAQDLLAENRLPVLGCIVNDFTNKSRQNSYYYSYYGDGNISQADAKK